MGEQGWGGGGGGPRWPEFSLTTVFKLTIFLYCLTGRKDMSGVPY